MSILPANLCSRRVCGSSGFTLAEMMVSIFVYLFIFVGVMVAIQIFGLRVYTLAATKLSATTGGRQTLNTIRDQIRRAQHVYVGTYNPTNGHTFAQAPNGSLQMGNALAVIYTNRTSSNYMVYYQDSTQPTNLLCSVSTNGTVTVLAKYVTNYYCFYAEDYQTNVLTTYNNNPVIHVILQFDQWEYPIAFIGTGTNTVGVNAYDYYRLQTRISRRLR